MKLGAQEFDEAIEWYELQMKGLGKRFRKSVLDQIKKMKRNPKWFPIEDDDIYKAYIPKFPYKIIFTVEDETIVIWAVAHMHRKPWYWQSRLS